MVTPAIESILNILGDYISKPKDRTRDRIILSAKKRFLAEGFAKVTIGELCHDLRISKKTFYKHFKDKEDLVFSIVAGNLKMFIPRIQEIINSDEPPEVRLNMYMDFFFNIVTKNISVPFLKDMQAMIPELWDLIDKFRQQHIVENITKIFKEGQKAGVYRADVDSEKLTKIILLIVDRVMTPQVLYENGLQMEDVGDVLFKILRGGVFQEKYNKED